MTNDYTEEEQPQGEERRQDMERPQGAERPQEDEPQAAGSQTPTIPLSPLSKSIAALLEAHHVSQDRLLRTAADFENYKKRSRKESLEGVQRAENRVVTEFLPVLDNLERALGHTEAEQGGLLEGVKMVHKQFLATLERYDIKPFQSIGEVFNPERHEAIQQIHSDRPVGMICEELQVGYLRGDRLVRPSMVIVSLGQAAPQTQGEEGNQGNIAPDGDASGDGETEEN